MARENAPGERYPVRRACRRLALAVWTVAVATSANSAGVEPAPHTDPRPRARELGIVIGILPHGELNAITDVPGVRVGHRTLREGEEVRTGVTAIVPHADNVFQQKVPAAIVVGNGFGKLVGATQVEELGALETPILLTNTLSTFAAADVLVGFVLDLPGNERVHSVNPVVGETNDGYLNDIRARRVAAADVLAALSAARGGPVEEGSVGAGTGTRCMGFKGGIGTASRKLRPAMGGHTLGVLVQTNFDGRLTINGAAVGDALGRPYLERLERDVPGGGSCMIVLATDAPLDARQLRRVAKRALLGLAAAGSAMEHGSGDYVIAFSTAKEVRAPHAPAAPNQVRTVLRDETLSPLFQAAREAAEEAILNSLLRATTVTGHRGRTVEAIPIGRLVEVCRQDQCSVTPRG